MTRSETSSVSSTDCEARESCDSSGLKSGQSTPRRRSFVRESSQGPDDSDTFLKFGAVVFLIIGFCLCAWLVVSGSKSTGPTRKFPKNAESPSKKPKSAHSNIPANTKSTGGGNPRKKWNSPTESTGILKVTSEGRFWEVPTKSKSDHLSYVLQAFLRVPRFLEKTDPDSPMYPPIKSFVENPTEGNYTKLILAGKTHIHAKRVAEGRRSESDPVDCRDSIGAGIELFVKEFSVSTKDAESDNNPADQHIYKLSMMTGLDLASVQDILDFSTYSLKRVNRRTKERYMQSRKIEGIPEIVVLHWPEQNGDVKYPEYLDMLPYLTNESSQRSKDRRQETILTLSTRIDYTGSIFKCFVKEKGGWFALKGCNGLYWESKKRSKIKSFLSSKAHYLIYSRQPLSKTQIDRITRATKKRYPSFKSPEKYEDLPDHIKKIYGDSEDD